MTRATTRPHHKVHGPAALIYAVIIQAKRDVAAQTEDEPGELETAYDLLATIEEIRTNAEVWMAQRLPNYQLRLKRH